MKDIIALAKEAELLTDLGDAYKLARRLEPDAVGNSIATPERVKHFAALLEAEIRKEFEVSIQYWKDDSAAAWDKCEERRQENLALTAQNAKLMEALKELADDHEASYRAEYSREPNDKSYDVARELIAALTQPEKEGKE